VTGVQTCALPIYAGPLNIEAVALDVCAALRAADQYCFPLRR